MTKSPAKKCPATKSADATDIAEEIWKRIFYINFSVDCGAIRTLI